MTFIQILALLAAALFIVGLPAVLIFSVVDHVRHKGDRPRGSGSFTAGIGAAMQELDRLLARPSAEHIVEAENPVLKREDDEGGGEGKLKRSAPPEL
jgi:hypothetical protein